MFLILRKTSEFAIRYKTETHTMNTWRKKTKTYAEKSEILWKHSYSL